MARKNAVVNVSIENGVLTYGALDQSDSFNLADLSPEIYVPCKSADAGLIHKVSLGAAIAKVDLPTDPVEAAAAKFAGMKAVADRIKTNEWSKRGEGTAQPTGVIFQAFAEWAGKAFEKKGVPVPATEVLREKYDAKTRAEQLALRSVPAIAKIIDRIKSEAGAGKAAAVNTDELLADLGI